MVVLVIAVAVAVAVGIGVMTLVVLMIMEWVDIERRQLPPVATLLYHTRRYKVVVGKDEDLILSCTFQFTDPPFPLVVGDIWGDWPSQICRTWVDITLRVVSCFVEACGDCRGWGIFQWGVLQGTSNRVDIESIRDLASLSKKSELGI